jgi:hypothetical protein
MKTRTKVVLIFVAIFTQLAWLVVRPCISLSLHGEVLDEAYRHDERFATLAAKSEHPSPATEAAFDREVDLLHEQMQRRGLTHLVLLLVLNGAGIYLFLHYASRKTTAQQGACT